MSGRVEKEENGSNGQGGEEKKKERKRKGERKIIRKNIRKCNLDISLPQINR